MEYLDVYDENMNYLGKELRDTVHRDALWHKTVHCWLYNSKSEVYFQIRKNSGKFYTTSSGHIAAGETVEEAFAREVKEEIGINVDSEKAKLLDIVVWKMDKEKSDGSIFRDRAFAYVNAYNFEGNINEFYFQPEEVLGIVKVNAKEALKLFEKEEGSIPATIITTENGKNIETKREVDFNEFLVQQHETAIGKYGDVLRKIIELCEKQ
jgi:8-oxo-dGTP pyrophosphatase MutT (NUDIX family)